MHLMKHLTIILSLACSVICSTTLPSTPLEDVNTAVTIPGTQVTSVEPFYSTSTEETPGPQNTSLSPFVSSSTEGADDNSSILIIEPFVPLENITTEIENEVQSSTLRVFRMNGLTKLEGVKQKKGRKGVRKSTKWTPKSALIIVKDEEFNAYTELGLREWLQGLGMQLVTIESEQLEISNIYTNYIGLKESSEPALTLDVNYCQQIIQNASLAVEDSETCSVETVQPNHTPSVTNESNTAQNSNQSCIRIENQPEEEDDDYFNGKRKRKGAGSRSRDNAESNENVKWENLSNEEENLDDDNDLVKKCVKFLKNENKIESKKEDEQEKEDKKKEKEDDSDDKPNPKQKHHGKGKGSGNKQKLDGENDKPLFEIEIEKSKKSDDNEEGEDKPLSKGKENPKLIDDEESFRTDGEDESSKRKKNGNENENKNENENEEKNEEKNDNRGKKNQKNKGKKDDDDEDEDNSKEDENNSSNEEEDDNVNGKKRKWNKVKKLESSLKNEDKRNSPNRNSGGGGGGNKKPRHAAQGYESNVEEEAKSTDNIQKEGNEREAVFPRRINKKNHFTGIKPPRQHSPRFFPPQQPTTKKPNL